MLFFNRMPLKKNKQCTCRCLTQCFYICISLMFQISIYWWCNSMPLSVFVLCWKDLYLFMWVWSIPFFYLTLNPRNWEKWTVSKKWSLSQIKKLLFTVNNNSHPMVFYQICFSFWVKKSLLDKQSESIIKLWHSASASHNGAL